MLPFKLSHYKVEEQIGAGGMGVVYRAHDEQLDRDVAIKILPAGALNDQTARKRFRKEAISLAKLNHPNIATVHEFGAENDKDFLVTEYVAGVTLESKLASGALPFEETVRLGIELMDGLSAAHERGIVHRDIKPANLRLTSDGRLKILDFGLAQLLPQIGDMGTNATETVPGEITGTIPYMAPEILQGEKASASSDIWSAGAVLYEMATGKRAFAHKNSALLIDTILNSSPESPRKLNAEIPEELNAVILKALAKNLKERYQSARDVARDLGKPTTSHLPAPTVRPRRKKMVVAAAVSAVVLIALATGFFLLHRMRPSASRPIVPHHRTVAVLGFKNLSGDASHAWLSTALSEMLNTELSEGDQLRTVPGESIAQMKLSLALRDADSLSPKTLGRIRQNLGSDDVVLGSYLALGNGDLRVDLRLQDTQTGETIATVSEKGSETRIDDLVGKAGADLRTKLGVAPLSDAQSAQVRTSLPDDPEAARLYSQGLQDLRVYNYLAAQQALERVVALKPDYAPAHSALAAAFSSLGYGDKAKQQAQKALDLSASASSEERMQIVGRSHEILQQWPEALEAYRALWGFFPDRVDYGLALARVEMNAGQTKEAEDTLAQLRTLAVSDADAARIDLLDATLGEAEGDFTRDQSKAEQAMTKGQAIGASLLVARSLVLQCDAFERMGQPDRSKDLCVQAKDLYELAGNRAASAGTLLMLGDQLFDHGDYASARRDFDQALAVFREMGIQGDIRNTNERIGNVLYQEGKPLESEAYYNKALQYDLGLHGVVNLASDYGNIANALDDLGDLKGSLKMQQQSLGAFNEVKDNRGAGETLNNLGNLSMEMGNLGEAKGYYEQALALAIQGSYRMGQPYPMVGLADVMKAQGDLPGARKQYEQALAIAEGEKLEDYAMVIHLAIALLDLEDEKFADGEKSARDVLKYLGKDANSSNVGAAAWAILAQNLAREGDLAEARSAADRALAISRPAAAKAPHFEPQLADALVKAKTGKTSEARGELEAMLAEAQKYGYRLNEYELRFTLCEMDASSGAPSAAANLAKLETDARATGFLLVANKARRLAQPKQQATNTN